MCGALGFRVGPRPLSRRFRRFEGCQTRTSLPSTFQLQASPPKAQQTSVGKDSAPQEGLLVTKRGKQVDSKVFGYCSSLGSLACRSRSRRPCGPRSGAGHPPERRASLRHEAWEHLAACRCSSLICCFNTAYFRDIIFQEEGQDF